MKSAKRIEEVAGLVQLDRFIGCGLPQIDADLIEFQTKLISACSDLVVVRVNLRPNILCAG